MCTTSLIFGYTNSSPLVYKEILFHITSMNHQDASCVINGCCGSWGRSTLGGAFKFHENKIAFFWGSFYLRKYLLKLIFQRIHINTNSDPNKITNVYMHLCQFCQFPNYCQRTAFNVISFFFLGLVCVFFQLLFLAFLLSTAACALVAFVCFKASYSHMVSFFHSYPVQ